ncbi:MAG: hypothetical protein ABJG47_05865 [Ekhidna sp.]
MSKLWRRFCWVAIIGLMIAFHNTYNQEFKSLEEPQQEAIAEDEEE